ncbi:hypothetical protein Aperf_G00000002465 [Anoplocephala perfoliata]
MTETSFDLKQMSNHFAQSIVGDDINLGDYCAGYTEVANILNSIGRIMYFVMKDVDQKLEILNDLRRTSKHPADFCEHFSTVKKMCSFEADQYEDNKLKPKVNATLGCRNLLRLHRAFLFIIDLFEKICSEPPEKTFSELAKTAYDGSLANYHPWPIQKSVGLAFKALPNREKFISDMVAKQVPGGGLNDEESCRKFILETSLPTLRRVYQITQDIYAGADMLDLP